MVDTPTHRDLFESGKREALLLPTRFDPKIIDTPGSDVNVTFNVAAAMGEEVAFFASQQFAGLSLATASGEALDRWVYDRYQMVRKGSSSAVVTLYLSRSSDTNFTVLSGSTFGSDTGVSFRTVQDVVFASTVKGPLLVKAVAEKAGVEGNVPAGAITRVLSPQKDKTLAVTNETPAAGGGVAESDDDLRNRARLFFVTARRGTAGALEFGALEVPGVSSAKALELFTPDTGLPGYRMAVYISDANGQANSALADSVVTNLQNYRAAGVPIQVVASVPQYVKIKISGLEYEAGVDTGSILQQVRASILASVNSTQPGVTYRLNALEGVLSGIKGLIVPKGAIIEPVGDLVPSIGSTIRTSDDFLEVS